MSAKPIYEVDAKILLSKYVQNKDLVKSENAVVTENTNWKELTENNEWLKTKVGS